MKKDLQVVVVDDQEQFTGLLEVFLTLTAPGVTVHTFTDPVDAQDYMVRKSVDVLIADYKMPGIDGISLFRSVPDSVKKIVITGYANEFAREKPDNMEVTVFEKPVPLKALGKVISEVQLRTVA